MRLLSFATPIQTGRTARQPGWMQERDRKARHPAWTYFYSTTSAGYSVAGDPARELTTDILWQVYRRVPDVRAAIDSIARRIATTDWVVRPVKGAIPTEEKKLLAEALGVCRDAMRWLRAPMRGKTWQLWLTMVTTDLLIYDSTAWEKVKGAKGKLEELNASRGDDWWPVVDPRGNVEKLEQRINGQTYDFKPEDVVYLNLFPNTTTPRGMPIIESIINEVIAILRASERAMLTMDVSEIPPGILYLTGVSGKAATDTINSFIEDAGRDHKMKVLHFPNPAAGGAEWLKLDYSPKEMLMSEVIDQVRRTIWRAFGVFPVEMGATDGMPRATAEVQIDASASHLLTPILELLQETITTQVLPHLVEEKWAGLLEFGFDFTRDLTPAEEQTQATADGTLVKEGILSRNEVRARRGLDPVAGGDVVTVSGPVTPLETAVEPKQPEPPESPSDPGDDDPDDPAGGDDPAPGEDEGGEGTEEEEAPGEVDPDEEKHRPLQVVHRHGDGCACSCWEGSTTRGLPDPDSLPSDWQPEGRFRGKRTLDLAQLGGVVSRYDNTIRPLYREAMDGFLAEVETAYADESITASEAARLAGELDRALYRLTSSWEAETADLYRQAAQVGDDACERFTGARGALTPKERGQLYSMRAMGYLVASDGPIADIRARVLAVLGAVGRSVVIRASGATVPDGVEPGMPTDLLLAAMAHAFSRNEHRISNWAGKLVDLGNEAMVEGMAEVNYDAKSGKVADWMVEWVNVGDDKMCATCSDLGSKGFVELKSLRTIPGQGTECGARDRCVLVYWTKAEVNDGSAALLGGGNTGRPL